jgi:Uma2 family endonuclease
MALSNPLPSPTLRAARRYVRAPAPLFFPLEEDVPESGRHERARFLLADSIRHALAPSGLVSSDQFLYWDPTNPGRRLAPDVAVRVGAPREILPSWKTWERGAPHLGVEIVSDSDASELRFEEKLERYRRAGVAEVVRFDWDDAVRPIRIWDLLDGDMVERDLMDPEALRSDALGFYFVAFREPELGLTLRLARDRGGNELVLTGEEAALAAKDAALAAKDAALAAEDAALAAKDAALARVAELEADLARRK